MIERPIWKERLAAAWKQAPIVWLAGLGRSPASAPVYFNRAAAASTVPANFQSWDSS